MKVRFALMLVLGLELAGCSTAPLTILSDNQVYFPAEFRRYPVRVEAIDRVGNVETPVFLEPGVHDVTIAAPPQSGFREPVLKTYTLNLSPCTRYYIAADRVNRLSRDWTLVIENQERVAGCDPAEEWKKAGMPERGTESVPASAVIISG